MTHENLSEARRAEIASQFRTDPQLEELLKQVEADKNVLQKLPATQKMALELYRRNRAVARAVARERQQNS